MAHKIKVIPAAPPHAQYIAQNLRACDRQELEATSPQAPAHSALSSFEQSYLCWAGLVDDEPVMIFGVATSSHITIEGAPWMLATPKLEDNATEFLRRCAYFIEHMRRPYVFLENAIDARNTTSIRWLSWLGFEIHEEDEILGWQGHPFHRFTMKGAKYV